MTIQEIVAQYVEQYNDLLIVVLLAMSVVLSIGIYKAWKENA